MFLYQDTQPVIHAIGLSHTACKYEFRQSARSHSWSVNYFGYYVIKIKIHPSGEIEYFVETHLCKLCVILRSLILRVVCPCDVYRSAIYTTSTTYKLYITFLMSNSKNNLPGIPRK